MPSLLGNDEVLIRTVLDSFRGARERSDLPSATEVIRHEVRNPQYYLLLPFMAGLEEAARSETNRRFSFDQKQIRLALAIHYTSPFHINDDQPPSWFPRFLKSHPNVVAEVLIASIRSKIDNGQDIVAPLSELAHSTDYADVARIASLRLLKIFPARCTKLQLPGLYCLLKSALQHCENKSLLALIEKKLAYRSMNMGQRIYWLVAGLRISPDSFLTRLKSYVAGNELRVRHLAEAVAGGRWPSASNEIPNVQALKLLIELMGCSHRPHSITHSEQAHRSTLDKQASYQIDWAINQLVSDPSRSTTEILEYLATDDNLIPWRPILVHAAQRQNDLRRESSFRYGDIKHVTAVLDNRRPANAADLAALTTDHLRDISRNIRDGNTSDWKQFWDVDSYNRVQSPRPEAACRDRLLSDLKNRLRPLDVDAQPEVRYADDKRSDIRVSCGNFNVPVEVKKSCHRDLWSAIRRQLVAKYTRDPGADGYGIYLVFWFGNSEHCRPTPGEKSPPKSADRLEKLLRDTLLAEEQRKISICVIDVAQSETRSKFQPSV